MHKNQILEDEPKIIDTNTGVKNGQNKCPKCGSTDISLNPKKGMLQCNFCRHEFKPEKAEEGETDLKNLKGEIIGSGAQDIDEEAENIITLKCSSCGAEVVIDTSETTQARCHWCRNFLSINNQVPNGAVPDMVLPFKLTKAEAEEKIAKFVKKRRFFANSHFKEEFTTENIMGVYFPYMVVDVNCHASFAGQAEREVGRHTIERGNHREIVYDADVYNVEREFDLTVDDLTIESNSERIEQSSEQTNNIINAILPFDVENSVKYNANYLRGYTSEKRDLDVEDLSNLVNEQSKDIARFTANTTLKEYDRGVRWTREDLKVEGRQWKTAYLPVWLYSYLEKKGDKNLLHYVAVNARTEETMGSVPINILKLAGISILVEFFGGLMTLFVENDAKWIFLLPGIIFFMIMYFRYRNTGARHYYEVETKREMSNLRKVDKLITRRRGLRNARMEGANNTRVNGNFSIKGKWF